MKYSICDQYWNKHDNFENVKDSVLFKQVSMQETCFILWYCAECEIDYIPLSYLLYINFSSCFL